MRRFLVLVVGAGLLAATIVALATASSNSSNKSAARAITPAQEIAAGLPVGDTPAGPDWPTFQGNLSMTGFSTLTQINPSNVSKLHPVWQQSFNPASSAAIIETAPIVVSGKGKNLPMESGTMFITANFGMYALDPTSGKTLWQYQGPTTNFSGGAGALGKPRQFGFGNGKLYFAQPDGSIAAINAKTGAAEWTTQTVSSSTTFGAVNLTAANWSTQFYNDGKDGLVFSGSTGGDRPLRGYSSAYNAKTGALVWRFFTTPDPTQLPFILTWANPAEAAAGGSAVWSDYTIDKELGLVYFGTGNPYPYVGKSPGKELFSDTIIAVNAKTGALKWYYQDRHHSEWDDDMSNPPVVFRATVNGKVRKIIIHADKEGMVYELDARNGSPIFPIPEVPVPDLNGGKGAALNNVWPTQPIPTGGNRSVILNSCPTAQQVQVALHLGPDMLAPDGLPVVPTCPFASSYNDAYVTWGSSNYGDCNYPPSSYSPLTHLFYITCRNSTVGTANVSPTDWHQKLLSTQRCPTAGDTATLTAMDPTQNGKHIWQIVYNANKDGCVISGVITTASGLVFTASEGRQDLGNVNLLPADAPPYGGYIYAYDAKNGKQLWSWQAPDYIDGPPITYAINGKQYLAEVVMGPASTNGRSTGQRDLLTVFSL
jgi:quinohemoprotein ethanol dehydrogenase